MFYFIFLLLIPPFFLGFAAEWNYDSASPTGPENWGKIDKNCDGRRQSPINIEAFKIRPSQNTYKIFIHDIDKRPSSINYFHNGHDFSVGFNFSDGISPRISGGPLGNQTYIFTGFHIHFPSEHAISGRLKNAELHLVHFNSKYSSLESAILQSDGLTVLGTLLEVPRSPHKFSTVRPFIASASNVRDPGKSFIDQSNLFSLYDILGSRSFEVYGYLGSLTTPNCNEIVTWLVNRKILPISPNELQILREIKDGNGNFIQKSNRPLQNINGRLISLYN